MSAYRRVLCWTLVSFLQTKGYLTKLIPVAVSKVLYLLIHKFKRNFMANHQQNLGNIFRFCALMLYHRATESMVFYEVHMTCILHTARISNVDSIMFVDRNRRDGKFRAW